MSLFYCARHRGIEVLRSSASRGIVRGVRRCRSGERGACRSRTRPSPVRRSVRRSTPTRSTSGVDRASRMPTSRSASAAVNSKGLTAAATNENGRVDQPGARRQQVLLRPRQGLEVGHRGRAARRRSDPPRRQGRRQRRRRQPRQRAGRPGRRRPGRVRVARAAARPTPRVEHRDLHPRRRHLAVASATPPTRSSSTRAGDTDDDLDAPLVAADTHRPASRRRRRRSARETLAPELEGRLRSAVAGRADARPDHAVPRHAERGHHRSRSASGCSRRFATGIPGESKVIVPPAQDRRGTPSDRRHRSCASSRAAASTNVLSFQDIFGDTGLDLLNIPGVARNRDR